MNRILAISDIHGHKQSLVALLDKVNYNPKNDILVLLGDYVDRGPEPIGTLFYVDKLVKQGAIALLGNHDDMFLEIINDGYTEMAANNGYMPSLGTAITSKQYLRLTSKDKDYIITILNNLKLSWQYDKYIFTHAGVNATKPFELNDKEDLIWIREEFYTKKAYNNKICIFGHTPVRYIAGIDNIWYDLKHNDKIGIDCGRAYKGKLACLEIPSMKEYYIDSM